MSLIDRYVGEIARRLPKRQREDVRQELLSALGDALDSRGEGEESEEQVVELLRDFGSPEAIAASYRPEDQFLIGPSLYPTFKTVFRVVLTVLMSLLVIGFAVHLAVDPPQGGRVLVELLRLLSGIWDTALSAFAIVVLIFALLQRFASDEPKEEESWDPRTLPEATDLDLVGRSEAILGITLPVVFLILMNLFRGHFGVAVVPTGELLLNDVFQNNLPWLNLALGLGIVLNALLLRTGSWSWPTRLFDWAIDLYWISLLFRIASEVTVQEATLLAAGIPQAVAGMLVRVIALVPWIVTIVVGWGVVKVVSRAYRSAGVSSSAQPS